MCLQAMFMCLFAVFACHTLLPTPANAGNDEACRHVPFGAEPPKIDGRLDDPCWQNALRMDGFRWMNKDLKRCPQQTEVYFFHDGSTLFFGVRCEEKLIAKMKVSPEHHDAPNWENDRVEFFINALGIETPQPCFYLSVNSAGVLFDSILGGGAWNPSLQVAVGREDAAWILEIAIPVKEMGKSGIAGERWRMNVGRHHRTSYSGASSFIPITDGGFCKSLGDFLFSREKETNGISIIAWSRGTLRLDGFHTGENRVEYRIANIAGQTQELEFVVEHGRDAESMDVVKERRRIPPGNSQHEQYYRVNNVSGEIVRFRVSSPSDILYFSENLVDRLGHSCRTIPIADPLYEPLLGARRNTPRQEGGMMWSHPIDDNAYWSALQYGGDYSRQRTAEQVSKAGFHFVIQDNAAETWTSVESAYKKCAAFLYPGKMTLPDIVRQTRERHWAKPILYASYHIVGKDNNGKPGTMDSIWAGWLPDPVNQKAFLDCVSSTLEKYGDDLWAVFVGDEQFSQQYNWGLDIFKKQYAKASPDSYLRVAQDEVKAKYGFGKFGIPFDIEKTDPLYPYCQRAYRTWLHDKLLDTNRKLRAIVKAKQPDMPIISDDFVTSPPSAQGAQYWSEYADIGSYQLCFFTPWRWMFTTKLLKDISGLDHLIMVPHDCDSGYPRGACSLEEMRELYSQILRGGGTGLHSWPASYGGNLPKPPVTPSAEAGDPLAWQCLLKAGEAMHQLPSLKFPETADTAIFISDESLKCDDSGQNQIEHAFAHLGPVARSWFRFVSDTQLKQSRAKLSDYHIIYLPYIPYTERHTVESLIAYVKDGGVLVCADPQAFEHDISSDSLASCREELFGVKARKATGGKRIVRKKGEGGEGLPILQDSPMDIVLAEGTIARATFEDDKPAITERQFGKGRALYFAWPPFSAASAVNPGWGKFFVDMHKELGGSVEYDIWRFQLPPFQIEEPKDPAGMCLTGNYGFWNRFQFLEGRRHNIDPVGKSYMVEAGDRIRMNSFAEGTLTNRLQLLRTPQLSVANLSVPMWLEKKRFDPTGWVEEFKGTDKVTITFQFPKPCVFRRVKFFFAGEFAGVNVLVSPDSGKWIPAKDGYLRENIHTDEREILAREIVLFDGAESQGKQLRLIFTERSSAESMLTISEVEIWGDEVASPQ